MIVRLVNAYGEQLRVQLGSHRQAVIVELAVAAGWAVRAVG